MSGELGKVLLQQTLPLRETQLQRRQPGGKATGQLVAVKDRGEQPECGLFAATQMNTSVLDIILATDRLQQDEPGEKVHALHVYCVVGVQSECTQNSSQCFGSVSIQPGK